MPVLYTTILRGDQVDLEILTAEQKKLLKECFELYRANCDFADFMNKKVYTPESMRIAGHEYRDGKYWITTKTANSGIYKVLQDLETMLGIQQGYILDDKSIDFLENRRILDDFLR